MIISLDKQSLLSTFDADCFDQIEQNIKMMAPSMVEYYLIDLASFSQDEIYINRSNIQNSLFLDEYTLHLDYSDNIYMEYENKHIHDEVNSLL